MFTTAGSTSGFRHLQSMPKDLSAFWIKVNAAKAIFADLTLLEWMVLLCVCISWLTVFSVDRHRLTDTSVVSLELFCKPSTSKYYNFFKCCPNPQKPSKCQAS